MWRLTKSTQGGSRDQSGGPGKKDPGQQRDTYQVPGPAWGMDWDIETRKTGSLSSGRNQSVCVCVCVCVCEGCIHVLCMYLCVSNTCVVSVSLYCASVCVCEVWYICVACVYV